jgi:hypothetical protein
MSQSGGNISTCDPKCDGKNEDQPWNKGQEARLNGAFQQKQLRMIFELQWK